MDGNLTYGFVVVDPETGDGAYIVQNALGGWLDAICPDGAQDFHDCAGWLVTTVDILWYIGLGALAIAAIALLWAPLSAGGMTQAVGMWALDGLFLAGL